MSDYLATKARAFQWIGIILAMLVFAGAYWYFKVQGSTLNQSENASLTSGLVGLWSYNGDDMSSTTAYDRSGNSFDGTRTNGPTLIAGRAGQALDFDGTDDYVSVADNASLDFTTSADFSISGWFYRDTFTTDDTIIAKRNGITAADAGYILYIDDATDQIIFETSDGTDEFSTTSVTTFTATGWHHFAIVWDDNSATNTDIYIDGIANNATDSGNSLAQASVGDLSNALVLAHGAESDAGNPFDGRLDEVRLYSRTLAAGEIKSLFDLGNPDKLNASISQDQGTGRLSAGVAGYWPLDDNSGTGAADSSTNSNNGTLTNGPTWTTGQIGTAVDFDGNNDHVSVSDDIALNATDTADLTITGWFNRDTFTTDDTVIAKRNGIAAGDIGYIIYIDDATDQLIFEASDGTDEYSLTSVSTFTATGWHHFVVTWDENSAANSEIYIDGVANNATDSGTIGNIGTLTNALALFFGAEANVGVGNPFDGKLDEVRLYNRVLSVDEIGRLYSLVTPTGIDARLDGYWSLDGEDMSATEAFDRSGAGGTGALIGTPTKSLGRVGQAINFDGTDDGVSVADNPILDVGNAVDLTVSGWFSRDTFTTDDTIIAKKNNPVNTQAGYSAYIDDADDKLYFDVSDNPDNYQVVSTRTFTDTDWHHFAVVWDQDSASGTEIYIDGVADNGTDTGTIANVDSISNTRVFAIGAESDAGNPFDGKIDEIRVHRRVLSASEIKSLYDQGVPDKLNSSVSQPQGKGRPESGIAAYFPLDENTGTAAGDTSINTNNGTLTNGPTWTTGQIGSAVDFDGTDDYVTVADKDVFDFVDSRNFALSGWFNRDTFTTDDTIVAKRNGITAGDTGYILYIDDATDKLTFEASDGTDEYQLESVSTFTATGWYYYALVWNDSVSASTRLYVNGIPEAATATGTFSNVNSLANSDAFRLGAESDAGNPFDGKIDDTKLYNRTLSGDEVAQIYRLTTPTGIDTSLRAYWPFNGGDTSGTITMDRSGGGNTGTLTNTPTKTIGKIGQALSFTGADSGTNQYVNIPSATLTSTDNFTALTLCAWIKPGDQINQFPVIITKHSTFFTSWDLYLEDGGTGPHGFGTSAWGNYVSSSSAPLVQGVWAHICGVQAGQNASTYTLYYNGTDITGTPNGTGARSSDTGGDVSIGTFDASSWQYTGSIDEVRVYNRALSAAEVATLYNQGR